MLYAALIGGGLALGLIFGRWWTIGAAAGLGIWLGLEEEVEVSGFYLGLGYAVLAGLGIGAGILARRHFGKRRP